MIIQIGIAIFALIALIGVTVRLRKGMISRASFMLWLTLWISIAAVVWVPQVTNRIAGLLGVGRGADAVLYISIVVLFYIIFRLYGRLEHLEHQLSEMAKKIALQDINDRKM